MSRIAPSGTPVGVSTTAGFLADPRTVSRTVPGSSSVPAEQYSSGPSSASTASWAKVSAFESRVGRPSTPLLLARVLRPGGNGCLPLTALTRAPPSPEMNRSGTSTTLSCLFMPASAAASRIDRAPGEPLATPTTISRERSARPARTAPPSTRCGARTRSIASFALQGSLSAPFTRTTVRDPSVFADSATALIFRARGKPAPPRPLISTFSTIVISCLSVSRGNSPCTSR